MGRPTPGTTRCQKSEFEKRVTGPGALEQNPEDDKDKDGRQHNISDRTKHTLIGVVPEGLGHLFEAETRMGHDPRQILSVDQIQDSKGANAEEPPAPQASAQLKEHDKTGECGPGVACVTS